MLKILGYADRLSVAPGETVRFMVSVAGGEVYQAEIVRIIHGDANPAGPGLKLRPVKSMVDGRYQGREQPTDAGSYARVPDHPRLQSLPPFTVAAMIWPTTPEKAGEQALISKCSADGMQGFRLSIIDGQLALFLGDGKQSEIVKSGKILLERRWYLVAATVDPASGMATLVQRPLQHHPHVDDSATISQTVEVTSPGSASDLVMAGRFVEGGAVEHHCNGKIDSPSIFGRALSIEELEGAFRRPLPESLTASLVAAWDFSKDIQTTKIVDIGAFGLDGEVVHLPARAMKGWNWDGSTIRWTDRPDQYGAIHFHDDDLHDCGWDPDFALTVPDDLASGAYAAHVWIGDGEAPEEEDYITFFVRPPRGAAGENGPPVGGIPGADGELHGLCQRPQPSRRRGCRDADGTPSRLPADRPLPPGA